MIDFHVHLTGAGCCNSGIFLSDGFKRRPTFLAIRYMQKVTDEQLVTDIDELWVKRIQNLVSESKFVSQAVTLCLDKVYSDNGVAQDELTQMYVPNSWGEKIVRASQGKLLFGASVHPYRKDAVQELERLKHQSVTLIKWLPSVLGVDPVHKNCHAFYAALRDLKIPLLSHTDTERTFAHLGPNWAEKNHINRLRTALEMGVTVIAAHAGTPTQMDELEALAKQFPNLYADTSGLFNPVRARAAVALFKRAKNSILRERLLFASDWPVPVMPLFILDKLGVKKYRDIAKIANPFDRDMAIKMELGFFQEDFEANEANLLTTLRP